MTRASLGRRRLDRALGALVALFVSLGARPVLAADPPALAPAVERASPSASGTLVVPDRRPLAFILLAPSGELASTSSSELIRHLGEVLDRTTDLFVDVVDASLVADCAGELGCMAEKLRPDGVRGEPPRLLLVLSMLGRGKKGDRASATLVDVPAALAEYRRPARDDPDWRAAAEALVAEHAVRAKTGWSEVRDREAVRALIERLVTEDLREGLDAAGSWAPFGALELTNLGAGWTVEIDGVAIGATGREAATRVVRVRAGTRQLALSRAGWAPIDAPLVVEKGKTTRYDASPREVERSASPAVRKAVLYTGAGLAAVGAAITTWSLARQDGDVMIYCLGTPGSRCTSTSAFQTTGYSTSGLPTFEDRVNPSGVLLAPLGYSLVATGAVWSLGTLLLTSDGDVPWPELLAGVAVGALAYGVSVALDGEGAFARR